MRSLGLQKLVCLQETHEVCMKLTGKRESSISADRSPNPLLFQLKQTNTTTPPNKQTKNPLKTRELVEVRKITWTIPIKGSTIYWAKYLHFLCNPLEGKNVWPSVGSACSSPYETEPRNCLHFPILFTRCILSNHLLKFSFKRRIKLSLFYVSPKNILETAD